MENRTLEARHDSQTARTGSQHPKRLRGFTLIELLVVIVILGLLGGFVAPQLFSHVADAELTTAKNQVELMYDAAKRYKLKKHSFPESIEQLFEVDDKGYQALEGEKAPADPWGNEYRLEEHPSKRGQILIICAGPNKMYDDDDDITSDNYRTYEPPEDNR